MLTAATVAYIAIVIAYCAILGFYLRAEGANDGTHGFAKATFLKFILGCLFCAAGILGYVSLRTGNAIRGNFYYAGKLLILLGLFFCVPGDFFLQYIRKKNSYYRIGIICFLIAQVLFVAGVSITSVLSGWPLTIGLTAAVLVAVLVLMTVQKWKLGPERLVLTVYTVFLTLNMTRSLAALMAERTVSSVITFIGAALFLTSDLLLGIWNYHSGSARLQKANWITYFAATMMIALSLAPGFDVLL